jgi:transcription elongation GreA/GreB family factor
MLTATRPIPGVSDDRIPLTPVGRARLEARLERLETDILPEIREALTIRREDPAIREEFTRAMEELERLGTALRHAVITDDLPDDPKAVEIGDLVTVRFGDGSIDTVLIVHPVEAPLDDVRVSFTSSFAQALLGASVGDRIEFDRPDGTVQGATITRAVRV